MIEVENLRKTFVVRQNPAGRFAAWRGLFRPVRREIEAVKGLSFRIEKGERVAFIGPNGAGKSTTIKMLTGILYPTAGELRVAGLTPWRDRVKLAYRIGAVFGQKSQLWQHLPATSTFRLLGKVYDLDDATYRARVARLSELFGVGEFAAQNVRQLSLGQRMRCEMVASLLHRPEVLLLDEPTIGLDVQAKALMRDLITRTSREEGVTVLLTSHDTVDMEAVCERAIVINRGELLFDRSVRELRRGFLERKAVTVLSEEEDWDCAIEGVQVVSSEPHRKRLEFSTREVPVERVIQEAMRRARLRDLTVEDPPMEEIVKRIYGGTS